MKIKIDWLEIFRKIRRGGRPGQVFKDKKKYDRKRDKKQWER